MRLNSNISALFSWRSYDTIARRMDRTMEHLTSGQRINRAADDVAGLAVSESMRSQVRSLRQSMANIQDEINLVQTAEGALGELSSMLLRGRELAVQAANGVLTTEDRTAVDTEMRSILHEIDRITANTQFNSMKLLGGPNQDVATAVESLRQSWLANSEALIEANYGLTPSVATSLKIVVEENSSDPHPAWVSGQSGAGGTYTNLELHINLSLMKDLTLPNGGSGPLYADRIIAHEMTHAVMSQTMDFSSLNPWFKEGAAEFIAGAEDRLYADVTRLGVANVVNEIDTWEGGSEDYSAAYAAIRYLHSQSIAAGRAGISDVMDRLANYNETLDQAIQYALNDPTTSESDFLLDFKANGAAFIGTLNLTDANVGAIGGGTAETVVPDTIVDTWDPLQHFIEQWPDPGTGPVADLFFGVGEPRVALPSLATGVYSLGLGAVNLVDKPSDAITLVDEALRKVTEMRTQLGALQNRMEHTYIAHAIQAEHLTAAESRIRDLDFAQEMASYAKDQILMQSSTAMMAQANLLHRSAVQQLLAS